MRNLQHRHLPLFNPVVAQEVDWARGYVAGRMTASQVPQAKAPITTFWEGEIVGCGGYRFHSAQVLATHALGMGLDWQGFATDHWRLTSRWCSLCGGLCNRGACSHGLNKIHLLPPSCRQQQMLRLLGARILPWNAARAVVQ